MRESFGAADYLRVIHRDFVNSIEDSEIKDIVDNDTFIAGGSIASLMMGEEPKDIDYYFRNRESCNKVIEYYKSRFGEKVSKYFPIKFTNKALLLYPNIHLIQRHCDDPDVLVGDFDFTHCINYYVPSEGMLFIDKKAQGAILAKKLSYKSVRKIDTYSIYRLTRFLEQGWWIEQRELNKVYEWMKESNLHNRARAS